MYNALLLTRGKVSFRRSLEFVHLAWLWFFVWMLIFNSFWQLQLLDPMLRVCLALLETAKLSSKVCVPFCVPTSSEWVFLLLHILLASGVVHVLGFGHSNRWVVVSRCFNLQLPDDTRCSASFPMLIFHVNIFFGEVSDQIFSLSFELFVFLFSCMSSLYYVSPTSAMCSADIFFQPTA